MKAYVLPVTSLAACGSGIHHYILAWLNLKIFF